MNTEKQHSFSTMSYLVGYALAVILTLIAFGLAYVHTQSDHKILSHEFLTYLLGGLALLQLVAQSIFFLHLSRRPSERSKLMTYIFTLYTVAFIVIGSIWIMTNLNSNMTPEQVVKYLSKEN